MPWVVGVVHIPAGPIDSVLTGMSGPFIVTMGVGRGGASLLNLLLGLKVKEGVCICCRLYERRCEPGCQAMQGVELAYSCA
jgi:hypothetical protein